MNERTKMLSLNEASLLHAKMCRAVGDPKRIQILYALADGALSVGALAELLESPQPTVSRHLAVLRESGMVATTREGTTVFYRLAVPDVIEILDSMRVILRTVIAQQATTLEDDLLME